MPQFALYKMLQDIRACRLCDEHLPHEPRPVIQANRKARILIAGQAPGRKVHASGIPFDDASGERLRSWMGIEREDFYDAEKCAIAPMGFCYPGSDASGDLPPRPECAKAWRNHLMMAMPNVEMVLAIGIHARDWHLPFERRHKLADTCKRWQDFWPDVVPMPHPSPRNVHWFTNNPWFEQDVVPQIQLRIRELLV